MHKSRLATIIIDCQTESLPKVAEFWSAALGCRQGRTDSKYVWLETDPAEPKVIVQKVDHDSRIHIDIETDDIEAEVKRLQLLGAVVVEKMEKWVIMQAPSKQRFCLISPTREDFELNANTWN